MQHHHRLTLLETVVTVLPQQSLDLPQLTLVAVAVGCFRLVAQ
jgi:hypothetical protein